MNVEGTIIPVPRTNSTESVKDGTYVHDNGEMLAACEGGGGNVVGELLTVEEGILVAPMAEDLVGAVDQDMGGPCHGTPQASSAPKPPRRPLKQAKIALSEIGEVRDLAELVAQTEWAAECKVCDLNTDASLFTVKTFDVSYS